MEEFVLFPLEKKRVKPGTVLIETVLSRDSLYIAIMYLPPIYLDFPLALRPPTREL